MALSTLGFGRIFRSLFFEVLGTIFACAVILLWCVVATATGRGAWNGKLFFAPCLKNLPKRVEGGGERREVDAAEKAKVSVSI